MNKAVWLRRILITGGVLETGAGLLILADPFALSFFLLRSPLEGAGLAFARIGGGSLLSLGIACWSARETPLEPAGLGVSWGFLAYNLVACVTLALARPALGSGGFPALSASVVHGLLAAALLGALLGRSRPSAESAIYVALGSRRGK